ncbi:MAG: hypothetical protein WAN17_04625 [Candidatus Sulfotelmatobacter sp.]
MDQLSRNSCISCKSGSATYLAEVVSERCHGMEEESIAPMEEKAASAGK